MEELRQESGTMEHRPQAANIEVSAVGNNQRNQCSIESSANVAQRELPKTESVGGPVNCTSSELCTFLAGLAEGYLPTYCLDTNQSAPLKSNPIASKSYTHGNKTVSFRGFPSLQMSKSSTASHGAASLTLCAAASRARTSPPPARAPGLAAPALDSGERWHALLVKFDPASCGWKTARCLWEEGLDWSCLTLPRWGSLHDGELWERATLALPTSERESGLSGIPTPTRYDATGKGNLRKDNNAEEGGRHGVSLHHFVKLWPTPRAANPGSRPNGKGGKILAEEVAIAEGLRERGQTFATPKSRDWKGQSQRGIHAPGDALPNMDRGDGKPVGGSLNPTWVEWLMGWIPGLTSVEPINNIMVTIWKGMHHENKMGRVQGGAEKVCGRSMQCLWFDNARSPASRGHEPAEQRTGQHQDSVREMPREGTRYNGERSECPFASMCNMRQDVSPDTITQRARVLSGLPPGNGASVGGETLEGSQQAVGVCLLRKGIYAHKGETRNVLAFMWQQACMGRTWWESEPPIPRVATGVKCRVDRLRCTGNGQVPGVAAMAWRILSMHNAPREGREV